MHILVVDSSQLARSRICKELQMLGHTPIQALNGGDAVEKLAASLYRDEQIYEAIITGARMRGFSGVWLIKYLNNRRINVPCLLHSQKYKYEETDDVVDLRTLSNRFPFVWYHEKNLKKLGYIQTFLNRRVRRK